MREMPNVQSENKEITWQMVLDEHWRQFRLACQMMNRGEGMPELNWREYVLYDLCKRHNAEIGKEYFKFEDCLDEDLKDAEGQYV